MKKHLLAALALFITSLCLAGVNLKWAVETSRVQPMTFEAVHGETLILEADFKSYGTPLELAGKSFEVFYQTNRMGSSWWRAPATVASNRVTAVFTPAMDPGASVVHGFLGSTGEIYRAAFTLRFRNGPGAKPNEIPFPVKTLDFAAVEFANLADAPWATTNDLASVVGLIPHFRYRDDLTVGPRSTYWTMTFNGGEVLHLEPTDVAYTNFLAQAEDGSMSAAVNIIHTKGGYWYRASYSVPPFIIKGISCISDKPLTRLSGEGIVATEVWDGSYHITDSIALKSEISSASVDGTNYTDSAVAAVKEEVAEVSGTIPKTPADIGAASSTDLDTLGAQVGVIGAHLNTEDAKFIVTNYNSSTKIPAAHVQIRQKNAETGEFEWLHIWNEMTRWNKFTGLNFDWDNWTGFDSWRTNIEDRISGRAVKEYAFYDGVTGDVAPDGYFWVGQPKIAICAGASYQRYVNGRNAVWILESNGMIADINGTTNGYFRISDAEGKTHFEIVKGDKRTVFAKQYAMRSEIIAGVPHYFTTYAITNAVSSPIAHVSVEGLVPGTFVPENDPNCPANVKWSAVPGGYTLEWWPKADYPLMFVYADYEIGGETYIRNTAPVSMQTIVIDGKKYKIGVSTIEGTKVLSLTEVE